MTTQQTSRDFFRHVTTEKIYAIESLWDGTLIGSTGPLDELLKDLDDYEYTTDLNQWVRDNNDKLILESLRD